MLRLRGQASHIATLLVLQAAGAGFASPAVFTASLAEAPASNVATPPRQEMATQSSLSLESVWPRSIIDWLPKDNQTTYILKEGEIRRLELNSSQLVGAPLIIIVSPCTKNLHWSIYHGLRNRTADGWTLVREYRTGETDSFSSTVSKNDRFIIELRGEGVGEAAGAVSARAERGAGVRLRLRLRSKRRLSASWDHSPIDPQATNYCVVASRIRSYTSLCAARHDRQAGCGGGTDCQAGCGGGAGCQAGCGGGADCPAGRQPAEQDSRLHNMAGEIYEGQDFKNYVRRKKYSRSTKMTDAEPVVVCVGSRTHHVIENLDFTKTYHVSVFGVARDRAAGEALAAAAVRPRAPRPAARALRAGAPSRTALRAGRAVFYYKMKPFSEGLWVGAVTCGGAVDIEVSVKGRRLHFARNVGPYAKFFVPAPRLTSSMQESEESVSIVESSSEEARLRYVFRVTPARRENRDANIVVEIAASSNRWGIPIPELQQAGGSTVRELRPRRTCNTLHVAFLPALYPTDVIRYCVTARELGAEVQAAGGSCGGVDVGAHARIHCADYTTTARSEVITQRVSGLRSGQKYAVLVTAASREGLPVPYTIIYADTSAYCEGEE